MHFSFVLVICLAAVFCLAPVGLYLLWVCALARRDRPTLVSGRWDFAILLAGLSGCLLFGGGLLLLLVQSNVRYWMRGNYKALGDAWEQEKTAWALVVLAYLLFVLGWATFVFLTRRRTLVIYNVEPGPFEAALTEVFEHLERPADRRGNVWFTGPAQAATPPALPAGAALCEVEPFASGKTVTLRWLADDRILFQDVERQLRDALPQLTPNENAAGRWLMSAAVACILTVVSCVVLLIYGLALVR